jgi:hypothetical protein
MGRKELEPLQIYLSVSGVEIREMSSKRRRPVLPDFEIGRVCARSRFILS